MKNIIRVQTLLLPANQKKAPRITGHQVAVIITRHNCRNWLEHLIATRYSIAATEPTGTRILKHAEITDTLKSTHWSSIKMRSPDYVRIFPSTVNHKLIRTKPVSPIIYLWFERIIKLMINREIDLFIAMPGNFEWSWGSTGHYASIPGKNMGRKNTVNLYTLYDH